MPFLSGPALAIAGAGAFQGLTSLFGASEGASAATSAASTQAAAEQQATALQAQIFQQIQGQLSPFRNIGSAAAGQLAGQVFPGGSLTSPVNTSYPYNFIDPSLPATSVPQPFATSGGLPATFSPTLDSLSSFPGYQFALQQGELATSAAYAPTQPGGAALKGAANYAEGLASTTEQQAYQQYIGQAQQQLAQYTSSGQLGLAGQTLGLQRGQTAFSDVFGQAQQGFQQSLAGTQEQLTQQQQIYNMYAGLLGGGLTAAGQGATTGTSLAQSAAGTIGAQGAAQAAGTIGSANALIGGASGLGSGAQNTALLLALNNAGLFGPSTTSLNAYAPNPNAAGYQASNFSLT